MSNENQKQENQQSKQQPVTTPAAPEELTDEQLEQVVGGCRKAGGEQMPTPDPIYLIQ